MDRFRVEVIAKTPNPQQIIYAALHQDYSEGFVVDERESWPSELQCGELIVKRLLAGERGHYGPLEHPSIVFNCGYFPHSVMQQVRTHRVGISFDVQCLSENCFITFVNSEKKTIGELYALWTKGEKTIRQTSIPGRKRKLPSEYLRDGKQQIRNMRLRVLNEETGLFEVGHIKNVICQGIQPVYRVTLEDDKTLDCTVNHRLFTLEGWQTMGDAVGLMTNSDNSVAGITKSCSVMCNGMTAVDKKEWLEEQLSEAVFGDEMEAIAGRSVEAVKENKLRAHPVKVKSVKYLGKQMTYDLEVEGAWHNFVANGMVVHNSNRYTGQRIVDAALGRREIEEVFYLRPVGYYNDRQGKRYHYTKEQRDRELAWCLEAAKRYHKLVEEGVSEEHARGIIPFDVRQHWVMSVNVRSLMHLLDLRFKSDAQLECQKLCELMWPHFQEWVPEIAEWYEKFRLKKARLAP